MTSSSFDFAGQSRIAQLARTYWLPLIDSDGQQKQKKIFQNDLVERIYLEDMISFGFSHRRCMMLELAQYLECWLWPNFDEKSSRAHIISICVMVNEKARERVPIWQCFRDNPSQFGLLIFRVIEMLVNDPIDANLLFPPDDPKLVTNREDLRKCLTEHIVLITFLSHCLTSLAEVGVLRRCLKDIYSLAVWRHLQPQRLEKELAAGPSRYRKLLKKLEKHAAELDAKESERLTKQRAFVANFVDKFLAILENLPSDKHLDPLLAHYLHRSLLLLIDLSSMLMTRRFLMILMDDRHTVIRCQNCVLYKAEGKKEGCLFSELVDILTFYAQFQVDSTTGEAVDAIELDRRHCLQLNKLQLTVFSEGREGIFRDFAVANPAAYESREKLAGFLEKLSSRHLYNLAAKFHFLPSTLNEQEENCDGDSLSTAKKRKINPNPLSVYPPQFPSKLFQKDMLIKLLVYHFAIRESHLAQMNSAPLYPTEELLWNASLVPSEFFSGDECLALPKLGLQFLTLQDYLMRNFTLFRLESTFEIRQDLEDALSRMRPWSGEQGQVVFDGWSRMALPIQAFSIVEVGKPALGAKQSSRVRADVRVVLAGLREDVQKEWQGLRRHDPVFLVTVQPKSQLRNWKYNPHKPFLSQIGILAVRGCEIEGQVDKAGKLIPDEERFGLVQSKDEFDAPTTAPTWRVSLDPCQYQEDINRLRNEKNRGRAIRAEIARAKREGRSAEAITSLEKKAFEAESASPEDIYDTFNVLVRRKPKENNFKAVLDTIRDLMNTRSVVPDWLLDLLMGYLDPAAAHYSRRPEFYDSRQNWFDTFLSADHLRKSFPQYSIKFVDMRYKCQDDKDTIETISTDIAVDPPPPYRLTFPSLSEDPTAHVEARLLTEIPTAAHSKPKELLDTMEAPLKPVLIAESYTPLGCQVPWRLLTVDCPTWLPGSTSSGAKPGNRIAFTPRQVEAIRAGMQPGLTMVVGPPGTGKTDIAVQTIHNLYHNYPGQRILVVTHSNQALNQLFEKIIALDIDERHLLRLGHGEEALATTKDFSRYGRVDFILSKRIELLQKSLELALKADEKAVDLTNGESADATGVATATATEPRPLTKDIDENAHQLYTCETAQYFFLQDVLPRWEKFISEAAKLLKYGDGKDSARADFVRNHFPFTFFITGQINPPMDLVEQIFPGRSLTKDLSTARSCFRAISAIFNTLEEFRAFELMRTGLERANFLLTQEAKIVAMTCTHAALKRRDLVQLGFTYDTIIMEEAAQILEIETFIPLLLQNPDISGYNRLKRWIMIGDHNQLPPVVKNQAFNNFSNMGQSLFARLVKLGVPTIQLDAQGRTRPSISRLYSWRYERLLDIPHVITGQEYKLCNPGFRYEYQLINVEDYKGVGESEPSAYFYQNLAEAEYVVATYMYMRILGYPADRITILTTYNGQKHLIRDVIDARCASNPLLGKPRTVTTVDRFQGQQNDYVLVSLVRTHTVGHLRDVRRLVVALSRARLGLYIFARVDQFANCQELRPAFDRLLGRRGLGHDSEARPTHLHLTPWETWRDPRDLASTDIRPLDAEVSNGSVVIEGMPMMASYVSKLYEERVKDMVGRYVAAKGPRKLGALKSVQKAFNAVVVEGIEEEVDEATGKARSGEEQLSPVTVEATIPNILDFDVKSKSISDVVDAQE
ncbi:intron binding protein aquarius [Echinococcus multilocularis]|uniref:Intron binding protein aquarius n=1 Tax=Echinococcus multilocularis TaxID=6211 RepID=A0A068YFD1_ECHMU|nr:intron binding protein aquarius [Echinococcus multilocularis]